MKAVWRWSLTENSSSKKERTELTENIHDTSNIRGVYSNNIAGIEVNSSITPGRQLTNLHFWSHEKNLL